MSFRKANCLLPSDQIKHANLCWSIDEGCWVLAGERADERTCTVWLYTWLTLPLNALVTWHRVRQHSPDATTALCSGVFHQRWCLPYIQWNTPILILPLPLLIGFEKSYSFGQHSALSYIWCCKHYWTVKNILYCWIIV